MLRIWTSAALVAALLSTAAPAQAAAAPSAPSGVSISVSGTGVMSVSWSAVTADPAVSNYTATAFDANSGGASLGTCSTATTTCDITMSPATATHYVAITATNTSGTSPASTRVAVPGSPAGLAVTTSGSSSTANWTALSGASSYTATAYSAVTGGTSQGACTAIAPSVTCTINGLAEAGEYFYAVRATIGAVTGPDSARVALCNGYSDLCSRPFNETVFAGTHNSMASDRAWGPFLSVNPITTQTYTIREQLDRGIRALSFDVWYGRDIFVDVWNADGPTRSGVEPYLCHSYCTAGATRLEEGFGNVKSFLEANPREVVVIYFEDYISVADTQSVVQSSGLSDYVYNWSGSALPYTTTLGDMITSGKRVVLISQNVSTANQTAWYPRLTSMGMDTDYDFSSTDQLTDPAQLAASCQPTPWGRRGNGRFLVMQHFITNIIASVSSSAVVNTQAVLTQRALACQQLRGVMPSVLLVDYFEEGADDGGVLGATRALNDLYSASAPRITTVSPSSGAISGGTAITLTGVNLTGATAVTIGGTAATSVVVSSSTSITAVTPAGTTGRADVVVTAPSDSFRLWSGYTYGTPGTPAVPTVTSAAPARGVTTGGQTVVITGTGFTDAEEVTFGGAPAESFVVANDTSITAVTPPGLAGGAEIEVITEGGTGSLTDSFIYVEPVSPSPATNPDTAGPQADRPASSIVTPPTAVVPPGDITLTPAAVAAMTPQQVSALTPAQAATFTAAFVEAMSPQQIRALEPAAFARLSPRAVATLSADQARQLRPKQMAAVKPAQVAAMSRSALRALTPQAIAAMGVKSRAALTPDQRRSLRPIQVQALTRSPALQPMRSFGRMLP